MNDLMLKKIEDNTIKDVRSLFRPKKKKLEITVQLEI